MRDHFYKFIEKSLCGEEISMEAYKDKIVLVVNTASKCGLTPSVSFRCRPANGYDVE